MKYYEGKEVKSYMWMAYVHMRMLLAQREKDGVRIEHAC